MKRGQKLAGNQGGARRARTVLTLTLGLAVLFIASLTAGAQATPQVRQPDDASFSAEAKAALAQGLASLESILAAPTWGSGRIFGAGGWGTQEFAIYTAGALSERGYSVTIVRADASAGARTWLLVGLSLSGTVAWVPVEPSPDPGRAQTVLGRIPMSVTGSRTFDAAYVTYGTILPLPPNALPFAKIRPQATRPAPHQTLTLLALGSFDPDGAILVYRWDFGDGTTAAFYDGNAAHAYTASGAYTITLTVIDSGGRSGTTTMVLAVGSGAPMQGEAPKPDCGCGG